MKLLCPAKRLVPIFPDGLESATTKDGSYLGGGTFVADLKLAGGEFVFPVLILRRDNAATQRAMQMFAALPCVTTRLSMAACTHHGNADGSESIAQWRALTCAEDDPKLWEGNPQRAHQLHKFAVAH